MTPPDRAAAAGVTESVSTTLPPVASTPEPAGEPPSPALPAHLVRLAERARDYVEAASSADTRRAYASDWKHFAAWCRR